jgi:hypothetical protein
MATIAVFEPALCCNTGVCGEDLDQNLVAFTADMAWLVEQGASITRHNLANDPMAFAHNAAVKSFLEISGSAGLPLVSVDGVAVTTGRYPTRAELARWAGLETAASVPDGAITLGLAQSAESSCCGDSGCC